ncbi:MAG: pseudouridine synthase [Verrucomicrobiota bacterium]
MITGLIKLSSPATKQFWEIPILYEDDRLLALDKPSQLPVSPDRYNLQGPSLMKLLHRDIGRGAPWSASRQIKYLANAHRLDSELTGVILLAKDKATLIALADQFGIDAPTQTYVALAHRNPTEHAFQVNAKLARDPVEPRMIRVDEKQGKRASTSFEILEKFAAYTLLKCRPLTSRTHQIRVHLQHAGHPVVGDSLYGGGSLLLSTLKPNYRLKPNRTERPLLDRVALHAESLRIIHPVSKSALTITAPWPKDLVVAVKYLRRFAVAR